ncbi:hypothetical protein D3C73_1244680 [compost metagenome]
MDFGIIPLNNNEIRHGFTRDRFYFALRPVLDQTHWLRDFTDRIMTQRCSYKVLVDTRQMRFGHLGEYLRQLAVNIPVRP